MYSNINIYANFFIIIIIMYFAPLISSQISPDYYKTSCPSLQEKVWWGVWNASRHDPRMPASILRLHFHDCFVNGCDASVLLDDEHGERSSNANKNSARGFDVIDKIKADVETKCKEIVSCADILALAARAAVKLSMFTHEFEGPREKSPREQPWGFVGGRRDGFVSDQKEANRWIPSPGDRLDTIIAKFRKKGLSLNDTVALSGAHTIGFAHCSNFMDRMQPNRDRSMNPKLYSDLQKDCSHDKGLAPLDSKTPQNFDNNYYVNLLNHSGVLKSDQVLWTYRRTKPIVETFRNNSGYFLTAFRAAMEKMGIIDVIIPNVRSPVKEDIRRKCSKRNV